jgi:hypothetical protein
MSLLSSPRKSPRHMESQSAADFNMASFALKSSRLLLGRRPTVDSPIISTPLEAPDRAPIRSSMARVQLFSAFLLGCLLVINLNILLQVQEPASEEFVAPVSVYEIRKRSHAGLKRNPNIFASVEACENRNQNSSRHPRRKSSLVSSVCLEKQRWTTPVTFPDSVKQIRERMNPSVHA